jgi:hypothetical protein
MSSGGAPNREAVIGSIVLAFSHSSLKEVAGTDALRSVLGGNYRDIVKGDTIDLQPVWDLLKDQPGFREEAALPPFSLLKSWEEGLKGTVQLPREMGSLSAAELMVNAARCQVPKSQRQAALDPEGSRQRARELVESVSEPRRPDRKKNAPVRRPALEAILGVVAVAGLVFGGYTLAGFFGGPSTSSISVDEIGGEMPLASAKRLGNEVDLVISDPAWFDSDEGQRRASLSAALEGLSSRDIDVLVVRDKGGVVRASAQWIGDERELRVRLE